MKKLICLVITLTLAACTMFACTNDKNENETVTNIQTESKTHVEPNPASDFQCTENEDGTVTISRYMGSSPEVVIPSQIDGKDVTIIGEFAFVNCNVASVRIPDTVVEIENSAFREVKSLVHVSLPDSLKNIGSYAFSDCTNLKQINIPAVTLHENAFINSGIVNVNFEDGIECIPSQCFSGTNIKELVLPGSVRSIKSNAFSECKQLEKVTLNEGLTTIGGFVFENSKITQITIPESVTEVNYWSFSKCKFLKSVIFEGNAPANYIFDDFEGFRTSNYTIYYKENASGFTSPVWNGIKCQQVGKESSIKYYMDWGYGQTPADGIIIYEYTGNKSDIEIPEEIDNLPVTHISIGVFAYSNISSVRIPDTVVAIEAAAFYGCEELTSVELSKNLQIIGNAAFSGCSSIAEISLPNKLIQISPYSFSTCRSLTSIHLPGSVNKIGTAAFFNCKKLESIEFESGLEVIEHGAFIGAKIESLEFPDTLKIIEKDAFNSCIYLKSILFNNGLISIGDNAFSNASDELIQVIIPSTVTSIASNAFDRCSGLKDIIFQGNKPENFS